MPPPRQTLLITGAAKRIGAALARHFAADHDLVVHYHRSKAEAEKLARELRALGTGVTLVKADLTDTASLKDFWKKLPPCTGFIHNASSFVRDTLADMTPDSLREHLAIHLEAPLLLAQGFLAQLPKKSVGSIVVIGDGEFGWSVSPRFFFLRRKQACLGLGDRPAGRGRSTPRAGQRAGAGRHPAQPL